MGIRWEKNIKLCRNMLYSIVFSSLILSVVIPIMIMISGDVHPNPGLQTSESSSSLDSTDLYNFLNLPNYLSNVYYNVKNKVNTLDTLIAEFSFVDIVSFFETWLHNEYPSNESIFPSFRPSVRNDRVRDKCGGIILYVKNNIRRYDLVPIRLECIRIQIKSSKNRNIYRVYSMDH